MSIFAEYGAFKIPSGMTNSVDPDQTAPQEQSDLVCTVYICYFVRNLGI